MRIDLHIHTKTGSDGAMTVDEVFIEAKKRKIDVMAITDHDNIEPQVRAKELAARYKIHYITGVELNITLPYNGKNLSLDFLGYNYNHRNQAFKAALRVIKNHREKRAKQIIENLNAEFKKENLPLFDITDLKKIEESADGIMGRPHIADYLISKKIVATRQEAFDKYLVKCDVPKYPLMLEEAAALVHGAGGKIVLAHPNDPNGTSLASVTKDLNEQTKFIEATMLEYIDGIECWHSRADAATTAHYLAFCREHKLITTGGSDCHQKPVIMGTVDVPKQAIAQFK